MGPDKHHPIYSFSDASLLLAIIGYTNTLSRVVLGYLSDKSWMNRLYLYNGALAVCGLGEVLTSGRCQKGFVHENEWSFGRLTIGTLKFYSNCNYSACGNGSEHVASLLGSVWCDCWSVRQLDIGSPRGSSWAGKTDQCVWSSSTVPRCGDCNRSSHCW